MVSFLTGLFGPLKRHTGVNRGLGRTHAHAQLSLKALGAINSCGSLLTSRLLQELPVGNADVSPTRWRCGRFWFLYRIRCCGTILRRAGGEMGVRGSPRPGGGVCGRGPSPDDTVPALPRPSASKTRRQATSGGVGEGAAGEKGGARRGSGVVAQTSGGSVGVGGGPLEKFLMKIPAWNKIFAGLRPRNKYWYHVELTLTAIALVLCIA